MAVKKQLGRVTAVALVLAAIFFAILVNRHRAATGDVATAVHVLCRGQERYIDCKARWADAYAHGLAAPDPATVITWWNQGAECRLQGFDLYDEETGHCLALDNLEIVQ